MKKIDVVIDVITGEQTVTERDETIKEKKEREIIEKELAELIAKENEKKAQRQAIAERLGLTAEELQVFLG